MDPKKIASRYIRSDFFINVIATLPLPQIVIWFIIPATRSPQTDHKNNALALIVLLQYVPRLYLIFPLSSQIIKATGVVTKTAWGGAAYNLLLYMLASHVLGASWYLLSVDRYTTCWKSICKREPSPEKCFSYLDCSSANTMMRRIWANTTNVFNRCDPNNDIDFKFGIFENAVKKQVVSSNFIPKYFYCLWWGLQQLSSYGQNLNTSTFIGETSFAILIAIMGLVLFSHLIGNMQLSCPTWLRLRVLTRATDSSSLSLYMELKKGKLVRGELVMDPKKIASRYIRSDFFIDVIATLPLPQIVIWFIIPATRSPQTDHKNNALALIVLLQYVPRLYLIFPLSSQIIKATGVVTKTAWGGAAYNLLLYMLASHVLGASWYLLSVDRYTTCWKSICKIEPSPEKCFSYLDCSSTNTMMRRIWADTTHVFNRCDPNNDIDFKFGIFESAVKKQVVSSNFIPKYFYCLWWGLQQLSSYGQNLNTSTFIGETSFAILIAIMGLVLFSHLIGNMQWLMLYGIQLYAASNTIQFSSNSFYITLVLAVLDDFVQYKWLATRGVDEETILRALPADLRRDIQRHVCLDLVRRV
ncbi:hypothetical protein PIB30_035839 [Stylosanthes scabra]|uniref:Ion transport domain-containing protein n=1 Tax=Stylosanthes scabra TaxID=79078 RepID=A0ABU6ZAY2_9FABA|nr:hypothetical protein [Stylosanthes scabra]